MSTLTKLENNKKALMQAKNEMFENILEAIAELNKTYYSENGCDYILWNTVVELMKNFPDWVVLKFNNHQDVLEICERVSTTIYRNEMR